MRACLNNSALRRVQAKFLLVRPENNTGYALLGNAKDLSDKNMVRILNLMAISFEDSWPFIRVAVIPCCYAGECIATGDSILCEAVVWIQEGPAKGNRHHNLVQIRPVLL